MKKKKIDKLGCIEMRAVAIHMTLLRELKGTGCEKYLKSQIR